MSKFYVLDNHRQLKGDEIIREGDLYKDLATGKVSRVHHSIGHTPSRAGYIGTYNFYRRLHTKKPKLTIAPRKPVTVSVTKPADTKTPRFPEVKFLYPSTKRWGAPMERHVKVISQDDQYIVGLEVLEGGGHQFKRFCVDKVRGEIRLIKF